MVYLFIYLFIYLFSFSFTLFHQNLEASYDYVAEKHMDYGTSVSG